MNTLHDVITAHLRSNPDKRRAPTLRHRLNCWCRHASSVLPITSEEVSKFQRAAVAAELSPVTINDTIADICYLLRETGHTTPIDVKRLEESPPNPIPPAVSEVGKLYAACDQSQWPTRWNQQERTWWWQGYSCLQYHWPFRNGDIFRLTASNLIDAPGEQFPRVECKRGSKTGALYAYPITETCRRHLANLLRIKTDPSGNPACGNLFMVKPGSVRFVRAELKRLCKIAGIPEQTPKKIRSASLTAYECLDGDCGQLAHHGLMLGVRAHYVPHAITMAKKLWRHISNFDVPDEMLDANERRRNRESLAHLMRIAKRMPAAEIQRLARMAEAM